VHGLNWYFPKLNFLPSVTNDALDVITLNYAEYNLLLFKVVRWPLSSQTKHKTLANSDLVLPV
jgi:hypothetical protein